VEVNVLKYQSDRQLINLCYSFLLVCETDVELLTARTQSQDWSKSPTTARGSSINGALTHAYLHFMVVSFVALHLLHQEMVLPFLSE